MKIDQKTTKGGKTAMYLTYYPQSKEIQLLPGDGIIMEVPENLFPIVQWLYRRIANISNPVPNDLKKYLTLNNLCTDLKNERGEIVSMPSAIASAAAILIKLGVAEFEPAHYMARNEERFDFALVPRNPIPLINKLVWP